MAARRHLLLAAAGLCGLGGAVLLRPGSDPAERMRRLGLAQGILVAAGDPRDFHRPPFGPQDALPPGVAVEPAEPAAIGPALDGLEASMAQYPPDFMARLVSAVFIGGAMTIEGEAAGGTYGPAWILLSAPLRIGAGAIRETCRLGLHHELSSFVYARGDTARRWRATLPDNWDFAPSAAVQLRRDRGLPPPESGFLDAYGATSPENDFNVYAEKVMTDAPAVLRLAARLPLVARKVALLRQSYGAIDPRMDAVFQSFGIAG
jgi:hypothetical protein